MNIYQLIFNDERMKRAKTKEEMLEVAKVIMAENSCVRCKGEGELYYPNGADDYDTEICDCCCGSGVITPDK